MSSPALLSTTARLAAAVFSVGTVLLCGCLSPRSDELREFSRLNRAVELLQHASNVDKAPLLEALAAQTCVRFCQYRDQCVDAYRVHQRALDLLARVKSQVERAESARALGTEAETEAAHQLAAAQSLLVVARPKTENCARMQGELLRSFGH